MNILRALFTLFLTSASDVGRRELVRLAETILFLGLALFAGLTGVVFLLLAAYLLLETYLPPYLAAFLAALVAVNLALFFFVLAKRK
ncbi:MAG: hypothetical protein BLITH_0751 [Brockia lithotrophica]|uniref:Uncharacterized protein n=1 Tax=Brockia lithotrophica TaxID=933949 RepID=A0A2T5G8P0_9BACL|nr:hypothetical protein [Brockia lithotrophica]PTQ52572.1 MAG: hypothetical protein BLITH_0751 [Brockia lithotrophica]